jgi:hypothetical protein
LGLAGAGGGAGLGVCLGAGGLLSLLGPDGLPVVLGQFGDGFFAIVQNILMKNGSKI